MQEIAERFAEHFLAGVAQHVEPRLIYLDKTTIQIQRLVP
jgi:hypothetical protein